MKSAALTPYLMAAPNFPAKRTRRPTHSVAATAQYKKLRYMQGMYSGMRGVSMTVACACQNVLLMGRIMKK